MKYRCTVIDAEGNKHEFEAENATQAVEYAAYKYPGYKKLECKSDNAFIQFGRNRVSER